MKTKSLHGSRRRHRKILTLPLARGTLLCAAALLFSAPPGYTAVTVSPDIVYHFSAGRGEGLSVSHDGRTFLISTPTDISADLGQPEETTFDSTVPFVKHRLRPWDPFEETATLQLEPGEATDVSIVHGEHFDLVVIRGNAGDTTPDHNALLAITEDEVLQRLPITGRPDGMKASPDGRYAVVAIERGGEILVFDISDGPGAIYLAARITRPALEAFFTGVPNPTGSSLQPEAVAFAHDSSFALVSIQESSSVAAVDMAAVTDGLEIGSLTPEDIGTLALKNVVHLPAGIKNSTGGFRGVEPDGVSVSPDGSFAMVINETHQSTKHIQSLSVLDLREGLADITAQTYSIFDIDASLLAGTGLTAVPEWSATTYPTDANKLPRLDPANVEIVERADRLVAAVVIERYNASAAQIADPGDDESRGSVLFLDVTEALDGTFEVIDRIPVGVTGSTLEGVDSAQQGRWIFVSISNGGEDRGTVARFQLHNH